MRLQLYILIIAGMFMFRCSETSLVGDHLLGEEGFLVSYNDSLTISLYTVKYDSLETNAAGRHLVGDYTNDYISHVRSESYFLPLASATTVPSSIDEDFVIYDSITMVFYHDGYTFYETEDRVGFSVYQMNDELEEDDDGDLYNTTNLGEDADLRYLGHDTFKPEMEDGQEIEIRLDDALGQEMFDLILADDEIMTSATEFGQYFYGFKLSPDENTPFYGFYSDSTLIRIHYTDKNNIPVTQETIDISMTSSSLYYNRIQESGEKAVFEELEKLEDKISSDTTDDVSLIMAGMGYATRLEIPYVRTLLLDGMEYMVSYAELRIYPQFAQEYDGAELPTSLEAYIVDHTNTQVSTTSLSFTLQEDEEFNRDSYYWMDINPMLEYLLEPLTNTSDVALLIKTSDMDGTVDAVLLGDMSYGTELIMYTIKDK